MSARKQCEECGGRGAFIGHADNMDVDECDACHGSGYTVEEECIDARPDDECYGPVEFHSLDPGRTRAWPRCERHWIRRLDRRENSIEKYENSDVEPAWFDPTYAGESW